MSTIHDVARRAGVSAGTVSNVLNRPSYVGAEVRERVLEAIAELDFVPTKTRRQFRPGRQRTLGLAVADMGNPFFVDIALGAEAEAKGLGVGVLVVHNGEDPAREEQNLDLLIQQRVHGIMIAPVDGRNPRLDSLIARGTPVVYVDRIKDDRSCCWAATDDFAGGLLAGEHLISAGHRNIGFVGDDSISYQVVRRAEGLAYAVERAGLPPESVARLPAKMWNMQQGRQVGRLLCARPAADRLTAVFCANDLLALGLLQEVVQHGIQVPGDLAIVGFDDLVWAGAATVPLTTVRQPRERLGRTAVRMLMDEISEPEHQHEHVLYAPELIVRESTAR